MYQYNDFDAAFLAERNRQFRSQVARRISGSLTEEEFKPLRLMNGLYLQLHAYMLRVAIPYGTLNSRQMLRLAEIAERWDKGYGHFTTRQNIQFNWPELGDVPDILDALAEVDLHAIQTSGNTIRNVTADHFAGAAADEIADPRPYAELIRQWSTDHPEFQFLPRKFKIAVTGAEHDRAVIRAHDIGLQLVKHQDALGMRVIVGGGLGRTPMIGKVITDFCPISDLLPYLEAVLRVFNRHGRRDNKYKARIKITVHENGIDQIRAWVAQSFIEIKPRYTNGALDLLDEIAGHFQPPAFVTLPLAPFDQERTANGAFCAWTESNTEAHRNCDHAIVTISLKAHGKTPGDATSEQMRVIAQVARDYAYDELRISHEQNVVLPHVPKALLPKVYARLKQHHLHTANIGKISDIIACPGMDYCALATARSIPIAQEISSHFHAIGLEDEIGALKIKISGCINACGHHHVGHIGILGLDRAGVETYQITLGGTADENLMLGARTGPGFSAKALVPALERLLRRYLELRKNSKESFFGAYQRLGAEPFKEALYHLVQEEADVA